MATREVPVTSISWRPAYRFISAELPTRDVYDRIATAAECDAILAFEALTDPARHRELTLWHTLEPADRLLGPGTTPIMTAFTRPNPNGSRFSDGRYGVYYCAYTMSTALAETRFHREEFMRAAHAPSQNINMRLILTDLNGELYDLRAQKAAFAAYYDRGDYRAANRFGHRLRALGANGIVYRSVREAGGVCAAIFRARVLSRRRSTIRCVYVWDGESICETYQKRALRTSPSRQT